MAVAREGQDVFLNLLLWDYAEDKYPRVYLRLSNGTVMSGSPIDLDHIGEGLYSVKSGSLKVKAFTMPANDEVTAVFKVFSDSGYTTISTDHAGALEVFTRDEYLANIENKVNQLAKNDIKAVLVESQSIEATVKSERVLKGVIESAEDIKATLDSTEALQATLEGDNTIIGVLEDGDE